MSSHHFIGVGRVSEGLAASAREPSALSDRIADLVHDCGLEVVARQTVSFDHGGLTLVWVLAESHLVLHLWAEEGFATIDLHVCDYRGSNAARARRLAERLGEDCFRAGSAAWRELEVGEPGRAPTAAIR